MSFKITDHTENSKEDSLGMSAPPAPAKTSRSTQSPISVKIPKCSGCHDCARRNGQGWGDEFNPRHNLNMPLHSWPELAKLIEDNRAFEAFPAFRDLNIKSLLCYQCELTELRERLHALEWDDHLAGEFQFAPKFCSGLTFYCPKVIQTRGHINREI